MSLHVNHFVLSFGPFGASCALPLALPLDELIVHDRRVDTALASFFYLLGLHISSQENRFLT